MSLFSNLQPELIARVSPRLAYFLFLAPGQLRFISRNIRHSFANGTLGEQNGPTTLFARDTAGPVLILESVYTCRRPNLAPGQGETWIRETRDCALVCSPFVDVDLWLTGGVPDNVNITGGPTPIETIFKPASGSGPRGTLLDGQVLEKGWNITSTATLQRVMTALALPYQVDITFHMVAIDGCAHAQLDAESAVSALKNAGYLPAAFGG